ncbi:MAG: hypothetical protein RIC06_24255 [Cyclobacteriaceae bacterium]
MRRTASRQIPYIYLLLPTTRASAGRRGGSSLPTLKATSVWPIAFRPTPELLIHSYNGHYDKKITISAV